MLAALAVVIALATPTGHLDRRAGLVRLGLYPVFVALVLVT